MARGFIRTLMGVASVLLLVCSVLFMSAVALADAPNGDCDTNSVIRCGVANLDELKTDYATNQGGNVHAVYAFFGIPNAAALDGMVVGSVTKANEVFVGDQKVATEVFTAGRHNINPSVPILDGQFWARPPSTSFRSNSLPALVKMENGQFRFAVIMSCGNPVKGTPTTPPTPPPPPKPPTPTPPTPPQPQKPEFELKKQVRVVGSDEWKDEVTAKPGESLEYRIAIENTGDTDLTNLVITDILPSGVTFADANLQGTSDVASFKISQLTGGEGVKLASLKKGATATIRFTVVVGANTEACAVPLVNKARVKTGNAGEKEAEAKAKVCKEQPVVPPPPQVQGVTTMPDAGPAGVLGFFSISSVLGYGTYRLKEFFQALLR